MGSLLAYADNTDATQGNFVSILICAAGVVAVAGMAAVVIALAKRRGNRNAEVIFTGMIFWAIVSLGSIVYATITQMKWASDHLKDLESGYGNPADVGPGWPIVLWGVLGAVWVLVMGWTVLNAKKAD
jgi:Kef-type K+ transport system membrane component KefB